MIADITIINATDSHIIVEHILETSYCLFAI